MSRIKLIILFCATLLTLANAVAQPKQAVFKKGDKVPNIELRLYQGTTQKKIHLYDLRKKLVLFDLWGVNCSSCIKSFPHMLELQKQFGDDIQIIAVTIDSKQDVEGLWKKLKGHIPQSIVDAYRSLPTVTGDTALFNAFPKNGVPTHIWLDSAYIVKSIAYGYSTTSDIITDFIRGKKIHFSEEMPQKIDFTNPISWIDKDSGFLGSLSYYSFILSRIEHAGRNDGQVSAEIDTVTGKLVGLSTVNMTLANLYKMAYFPYKNPNIDILDDRIYLEVKDKGRFYIPKEAQQYFGWADTSQFCLAVKVPSDKTNLLYPLLRNLLDSYFNYKSKMETRRIKCLVLKRITSEDRIKSKGGQHVYGLSVMDNGSSFIYKNESIEDLFSNLQTLVYYQDAFTPFFDETNYKDNIDITIPWDDDLANISFEKVRKALNAYGLDMVEEYKELEMLVISDAP